LNFSKITIIVLYFEKVVIFRIFRNNYVKNLKEQIIFHFLPLLIQQALSMKKFYFFILVYISTAIADLNAQDAVFTQFYATPMQMNPAFAGNTIAPRVGIIYRDQWYNIGNAYQTFAATYDQYIESANSGIGVSLFSDRAGGGILNKNIASVDYSYRLRTRNGINMKFGVEASVGQTSLDWDKLIFLDMIDPINGFVGGTLSKEVKPADLVNNYFDASAGFLVYNKEWYAGLSFKHLNSPNQSFINSKTSLNNGLPILFSLQAGYEIALSTNNKKKVTSFITPNLLIAKQGPFTQINIGAQGGLGSVFGGLGFRHTIRNSDAVLVNAGVKKGIFKINYSHDLTVNGLANSFGAHELSVILNFDELYDRSKPNYLDCFRFMR
jgi:type IX secretion system PorP/SprF family membrane protein